MRRAPILVLCLLFIGCSSSRYYTVVEEGPAGIPKTARAHCREQREKLLDEAAENPKHAEALKNPLVRLCVEARLHADCSEGMMDKAESIYDKNKKLYGDNLDWNDPWLSKFGGAWDRSIMEKDTDDLVDSICQSSAEAAAALAIFHGIRNARDGKIPWADMGWSAPSPGMNRCVDGCR